MGPRHVQEIKGLLRGHVEGGSLQKEEGRGCLDRGNKKVWKNEQSG